MKQLFATCHCQTKAKMGEEEELIKAYFKIGLNYNDILIHLSRNHNIHMCKRTLKRRLKKLKLFQRKNYSDIDDVVNFLIRENEKSGNLHGYKWMHLKCFQNNVIIPRNIVQTALRIIDPIGVETRKRKRLRRRIYSNKGPNYLWHADGYDKIKRFGICIHGCIDGFSRKIIWCRAGFTNNNPSVIAGYFISAVEELGGIPLTIRSDHGTENVQMKEIQTELRRMCVQTERPAYLYGTSPHNQRIESWWSILRKENIQFWMDFFGNLLHENLFCGDKLDKELVRFFFLDIIQDELNEMQSTWNAHIIRKTKNSIAPSGRPYNMYFTPETYGGINYLTPVPYEDISAFKDHCFFQKLPCDVNIFDLCKIVMEEKSLNGSNDIEIAKNNYSIVRREVRILLETE